MLKKLTFSWCYHIGTLGHRVGVGENFFVSDFPHTENRGYSKGLFATKLPKLVVSMILNHLENIFAY